ncbi:MAG: hypothetical protein WCE21_05195, partial [Candidatus Babeliales bacterium]
DMQHGIHNSIYSCLLLLLLLTIHAARAADFVPSEMDLFSELPCIVSLSTDSTDDPFGGLLNVDRCGSEVQDKKILMPNNHLNVIQWAAIMQKDQYLAKQALAIVQITQNQVRVEQEYSSKKAKSFTRAQSLYAREIALINTLYNDQTALSHYPLTFLTEELSKKVCSYIPNNTMTFAIQRRIHDIFNNTNHEEKLLGIVQNAVGLHVPVICTAGTFNWEHMCSHYITNVGIAVLGGQQIRKENQAFAFITGLDLFCKYKQKIKEDKSLSKHQKELVEKIIEKYDTNFQQTIRDGSLRAIAVSAAEYINDHCYGNIIVK